MGTCGIPSPMYDTCKHWNKRDISLEGVMKMTDINTVALNVRLTADAETRQIGDRDLTTMRCAFSHDVKKGEKWEEVANFIDAEAWGKRYKGLAPYLVKGAMVTLSGHLRQDRWTAEDGTKRSKHKLVVNDIQICRTPDRSQPELTDGEGNTAF